MPLPARCPGWSPRPYPAAAARRTAAVLWHRVPLDGRWPDLAGARSDDQRRAAELGVDADGRRQCALRGHGQWGGHLDERRRGVGDRGRATGFAGSRYVVRLVTPQAGGLVGVLCPQENADRPRDKGGISWKNCRTATWSTGAGRWTEISGDLGSGEATIGALDIARGGSGAPPIYLGIESGRVFLYSIPP